MLVTADTEIGVVPYIRQNIKDIYIRISKLCGKVIEINDGIYALYRLIFEIMVIVVAIGLVILVVVVVAESSIINIKIYENKINNFFILNDNYNRNILN